MGGSGGAHTSSKAGVGRQDIACVLWQLDFNTVNDLEEARSPILGPIIVPKPKRPLFPNQSGQLCCSEATPSSRCISFQMPSIRPLLRWHSYVVCDSMALLTVLELMSAMVQLFKKDSPEALSIGFVMCGYINCFRFVRTLGDSTRYEKESIW